MLDIKALLTKILKNTACPTVLFDNDSQSLGGPITLSDSAANYDKLTICYRTGDDSFGSVDVIHPNGKRVDLLACLVYTGSCYLKSKTVVISGTSIDTLFLSGYATAEAYISNTTQVTVGDYLGITQVIGYKMGGST